MERNTLFYLLMFAMPLAGTLLFTPVVIRFALLRDIVDRPGKHKTHSRAMPLLGGLAIFASFALMLFLFLPMDDKLISLVVATLVLVITGLIDDLFGIRPYYKLCGQTLAAAIVILGNLRIFRFMFAYFEQFGIPMVVVTALIIGWVVLMVNAFNLIDGLDGLAAGTAAIIFLAMTAITVIGGGSPNMLAVQLIGAGACLGFLVYNFEPARIFMGDTGSMLLGFILATAHLFTINHPFSGQLVLGSMFILAYPALDVGYALFRRVLNRSSIFKADKSHIHHVLRGLGLSVRKTVLVIYAMNLFFALLAVLLLSIDIETPLLLVLWILTALGVVLFFRALLGFSKLNGLE